MTFKIRCSAIGQIMTNDRSSKGMGKTAETYCQKYIKQQLYGTRSVLDTKEIQKGIMCEDDAIELVDRFYFLGGITKNELFYEDDSICGTPDIFYTDTIRDTKCSWTHETFPLFDNVPDKGYWWQLQGYMALTGATQAYLDYVLIDTPEDLYLRYNMDFDAETRLIELHTYSHLPDSLRIKTFHIERDQEAIESIYSRVEQCRQYIKTLGYE